MWEVRGRDETYWPQGMCVRRQTAWILSDTVFKANGERKKKNRDSTGKEEEKLRNEGGRLAQGVEFAGAKIGRRRRIVIFERTTSVHSVRHDGAETRPSETTVRAEQTVRQAERREGVGVWALLDWNAGGARADCRSGYWLNFTYPKVS